MIPTVFVLIVLTILAFIILAKESKEVAAPTPKINRRCVETYRFIKALTEKETPTVSTRFSLNYLHIFTLVFRDVKVEIEYNDIRREWSLEIWCYAAQQHLFWYTCTQASPVDAINLLVDKYQLMDKLDASLKQKKENEINSKQVIDDVIKRTLS